jgi:hypothetical protein
MAAFVQHKRLEGIFRFAAVVDDRRDKKLREDEMPIRGPAERVDQIAEGLRAARVFLAFEEAAALAVGFLEPNVVVLERVEDFCFDFAIGGVNDAAVRSVGEGGDVLVDGLERLVEVLGWSGRKKEKRTNTEDTEEEAQSSQRRMEEVKKFQ